MKKRTSKSASATPTTSSPSGTSVPTAATANNRNKKVKRLGKFGVVVAHLEALSSEQFRQSLLKAGIIGKNGKLTKKYRAK